MNESRTLQRLPRREANRGKRMAGLIDRPLCCVWLVLSAPLLPASAEALLFGDFSYEVTPDNTVTITSFTGAGGDVTIPGTIESKIVRGIGSWAFLDCSDVASVAIPDSVTNIGVYVFQGCDLLTSVTVDPANQAYSSIAGVLFNKTQTTLVAYGGGRSGGYSIPGSVTSIEAGAFLGCSGLTSVTIPGSVTRIGNWAFNSCSALGSVTIPDGVGIIGERAFYNCAVLAHVTIPDSVTNIEHAAFGNCAGLASVFFRGNAPIIGEYIFSDSNNAIIHRLADATGWPDIPYQWAGRPTALWSLGYTSADDFAYVVMPDNTIRISDFTGGGGAIAVPYSIEGKSVTSIGTYAFFCCTELTSITIPGSVTNIAADAFLYCSKLTGIHVDSSSAAYSSKAGVLFDKAQTALVEYSCGRSGTYAIPDGVNSIGDHAFYSCGGLTGVAIPDSVKNIDKYAFAYCSSLTSVDIPGGLESIGERAFQGRGLTNVVIPDSVTFIGSSAFTASDRLITATIGNGVTNVPDHMFEECTSLRSVTVGGSVVSIGERAFATWSELKQVYFVGNAPAAEADIFLGANSVIVYYLPGTTGWGATYAGRPAVLWNPTFTALAFDVGGISCTATGTTDIPVALEVSSNLVAGQWTRLCTTNLTGGALEFLDPGATNTPARFYRIVGP